MCCVLNGQEAAAEWLFYPKIFVEDSSIILIWQVNWKLMQKQYSSLDMNKA